MQITIPQEAEESLKRRAVAAGFASVEEYVLDLLELDEREETAQPMSYDEWRKIFREFVDRQTSRNPNFDGSRESIYPDR